MMECFEGDLRRGIGTGTVWGVGWGVLVWCGGM